MREIVVGSLEWYQLPHHGPWEMELAERCECGEWRWRWVPELDADHETSPAHLDGLIRNMDDSRWEAALAALENGLGWAANEGMSSWQWQGDEELLALTREVIRRVRLTASSDQR